MPTLNMQGPYEFSGAEIDKQITKTQAGNYAIGKIDPKGVFHVHYVGRSDMDVNNRLKIISQKDIRRGIHTSNSATHLLQKMPLRRSVRIITILAHPYAWITRCIQTFPTIPKTGNVLFADSLERPA